VIGLYAKHCMLSLCVYLRMPSACKEHINHMCMLM
jgi:hypothetical protein